MHETLHYKGWYSSSKPPYSISRATPINSDCCRLPMASVFSNKADKSRSNRFWSTSPNFSKDLTSCRKKENRSTGVHGGGGYEPVKLAREPASSRPKPCASLKERCWNLARSPLLVGPRRKKADRGQRSDFPLETSRSGL